MKISKNIAAILFCGLVVSSAEAAEVAYVEWTSAYSEGLPADWGYNAFDGKTGTAWCSSDDPGTEMLTLGFLGEQPVTEIGVIVGAIQKGALDKSRARLRELEISDGINKISLRFKDKPTMQMVKIRPTLKSQRLRFRIVETYPGERRSAPVCVSELKLKNGNASVTGDVVGRQLRSLSRPKQRLLHLWIDQPGAPERYLTFGISGKFSWVYKPYLEGKPAKMHGAWHLSGSRLTLTPSYGKAATLNMSLDRIADGDQVINQLTLQGEGPHTAFPATYQSGAVE